MITNLPAQVYGKNPNNLYDTLICADALRLNPVDKAVSFEWSPGAGTYPPVWALWVEPGQQWALLYCFEDKGTEAKGDLRPHTLRRTAGLCTRAELPLITALAAGKQPASRSVHESGCWEIEFEAPPQPDPSLWRTHVIHDGGNARYRIKMNEITKSPSISHQSAATKPKASSHRVSLWLSGTLCALLAAGIYGFSAYRDLQQRYAKVCEENRELREKESHRDAKVSELQKRYDRILERAQELTRELARELEE